MKGRIPTMRSPLVLSFRVALSRRYQTDAAIKINTGIDPHPFAPDIVIHINSDYLKNHMRLDQSTFQLDTPDHPNKQYVDAVGAFAHEIGHGLAFGGFLNKSDASPQTNDVGLQPETPFDEHVVLDPSRELV